MQVPLKPVLGVLGALVAAAALPDSGAAGEASFERCCSAIWRQQQQPCRSKPLLFLPPLMSLAGHLLCCSRQCVCEGNSFGDLCFWPKFQTHAPLLTLWHICAFVSTAFLGSAAAPAKYICPCL